MTGWRGPAVWMIRAQTNSDPAARSQRLAVARPHLRTLNVPPRRRRLGRGSSVGTPPPNRRVAAAMPRKRRSTELPRRRDPWAFCLSPEHPLSPGLSPPAPEPTRSRVFSYAYPFGPKGPCFGPNPLAPGPVRPRRGRASAGIILPTRPRLAPSSPRRGGLRFLRPGVLRPCCPTRTRADRRPGPEGIRFRIAKPFFGSPTSA